ncbi:glycosyltransferase family protein [Elstera sp.]|jgi:predicted glycosyltransferase|uniref:glycosyltransferase family protein n=1 Tax=Elstera sp. TaxID=1916664 RepID=UPI0037BF4E31
MKLLFHVQHFLGVGHHRRAEALARALVQAGHDVTVASGGQPVPGEDWGGAEVVHLPPARVNAADFRTLRHPDGTPVDDSWREARRTQLLALLAQVAPDVILLEGFPFARRQLKFELVPLLDAAKALPTPPLVATSLRDILVFNKPPKRHDEVLGLVETYIDLVLIHGDPRLVPLERSFTSGGRIPEAKKAYTGFVAPNPPAARTRVASVVVSVGGGAVGAATLWTALRSRPFTHFADASWLLVGGAMMEEAVLADLRAAAPAGVIVERFRADFRAVLAGADLSISMAGYNTALDILQTGVRSVLIPFAEGDETEQTLRAALFAEAGRAVAVDPEGLTPEILGAAVDRAAALTPVTLDLAMDGAPTSAAILAARVAAR